MEAKDKSETTEQTTSEDTGHTGIDNAGNGAAKSEGDAFETVQKDLLYLLAEFDNYKKRMLREQDQSIKFANERLIKEIIGVVDLLDRGVASGKDLQSKGKTSEKDFTTLLSGVEMTQRELSKLLATFGVEFIGVPGEPFDPARHEAISQQESPEAKDDTVLHVLQKGCLLHGRLLAPAKVVVAKTSKES
jgi:molecular chaperone GrpE